MKIINNCTFETKCIKDLSPGEVFLHHGIPFVKLHDCHELSRQGSITADLHHNSLMFFRRP